MLAAALMLAACGGGGDGSTPPMTPPAADEVPASAMATVQSFDAYALAQAASETAEPKKMDQVGAAPVSDTAEPIALP